LRANRQPEFTQIDLEMSFIDPDDIITLIEEMMRRVYKEVKGVDLQIPMPRMSYADAMLRYGSDCPDLRFAMEINDVTEAFANCEFKVFKGIIEKGGVIRAVCVPNAADKFSNTQLKPDGELSKIAMTYGAKGLAWFRVAAGADAESAGLESSITRFFNEEILGKLREQVAANEGDLILIVADKAEVAANALGRLRLWAADKLEMIDDEKLAFTWVVDFPLVEWNPKAKRFDSMHHPFTAPHPDDIDKLESDLGNVRSNAYDIVLNGQEIGGGSIRIHQRDLQERVFTALGISEEEAQRKFGFLLEGLSFGAPPHGGLALGLDRIMMILLVQE